MQQCSFTMPGERAALVLTVSCFVELVLGPQGRITAQVIGGDLGGFDIQQRDLGLFITQRPPEGLRVFTQVIDGRIRQEVTIGPGASVGSIIGSVNGRPQVIYDGATVPPVRIPVLRITLPALSIVEANLSVMGVLNGGGITLHHVRVNLDGAVGAQNVVAQELRANLKGAAWLTAQQCGGRLIARTDGTSVAAITGEFADIEIEATGVSTVTTRGPCSDGYDARATGMAEVRHTGGIAGSIVLLPSQGGRVIWE